MNSAVRASNLFSRRLKAPASTLQSTLNVLGEMSGKRQPFATESVRKPMVNEKQDQDSTMGERDKNIIQRMYQKYSMSHQKDRILVAESLFQAATSQASDQ